MSQFLINPFVFSTITANNGFIGVQVAKSSDQIGAGYVAGGGSMIAWDAAHYDTHNFYNNGASVSRLTIPALFNGYYVVVWGQVSLQNVSGSSTSWIEIYKNGNQLYDGKSGFKSSGAATDGVDLACSTAPIQVSTGDYFELHLANDADSAIDVTAARSHLGLMVIGNSISGAIVTRSTNLTAQNYNAALTTISWDGEVYDTNAFHDNSTNPSRITIPSTYNGRYGVLRAHFHITSVANNSIIQSRFIKNGSASLPWSMQQAQNDGSSTGVHLLDIESPPIPLATGDYHEVQLFSTDNSVDIIATNKSWFSIEILPAVFNGVLAKLNADTSGVNYTTPTALAFNGTDVYDTDAIHDPASNNTKLIIPSGLNNKWVVVSGQVDLKAVAGNDRVAAYITKGGTRSFNGFGGRTGSQGFFTQGSALARTGAVQVVTGDEFTVQANTSSDTSTNAEADTCYLGLRVLNYFP